MSKAYTLSLGCPIALCGYRGQSCDTIFYVEKCFYNSSAYKTTKPIVKKWF